MAKCHVKDHSVRSQQDSFSDNEGFIIFCQLSREPWVMLGSDRHFLYANSAFSKLMGLPLAFEFKGCKVEELPFSCPALRQSMILHFDNLDDEKSSFMINHFNGNEFLQPYIVYDYPLLFNCSKSMGFVLNFKNCKLINAASLLQENIPRDFTIEPPEDFFTTRELEILFCLMNLKSYKVIADELKLSIRTIRNHVARMFYKAEVNSLNEFILFCKTHGFDSFYPPHMLSICDEFF